MYRISSVLLALLSFAAAVFIAGCSQAAPQATGPIPDNQALKTNYEKALAGIQAMDAANGKGDTSVAKVEFTNFVAAWKVIAPAVSAKDAKAYQKLATAVDELQDEFSKAKPRKGEIEEEVDVLRDALKAVAPVLGLPAGDFVTSDPARLFRTALSALEEIGALADQGNWDKAKSEYAEFNQVTMSLRGQVEARDKVVAADVNHNVDALENALKPSAPDKAIVKAAAAGVAESLQKAAEKLGVKL